MTREYTWYHYYDVFLLMIRPSAVRPALPLPVRLHANTSATGNGVAIAMIDSDFIVHPDLQQPTNRIRAYYDAVEDKEYSQPPATTVLARHWHGTMTACTAVGNGHLSQGEFSSLAPDAQVVMVRTMAENGRIGTQVIVRALLWVLANAKRLHIRIVNLSVYADEIDQSLNHPVNRAVEDLVAAGVVVVAAAGNNPFVPIRPPAAAPSAITVGGLNDKNSYRQDDAELYHSTFGITSLGIQKPDIIAPSIWLPAPILPNTDVATEAAALCALDACTDLLLVRVAPFLLPSTKIDASLWASTNAQELRAALATRIEQELIASAHYKMVDGTSFASPIVCSIIAQMLELEPLLTPAEVKQTLMATAVPLASQPALRQGAGVVQQRAAIALAQSLGALHPIIEHIE